MFNITGASNIGVHAMAYLASSGGDAVVTLREISSRLNCSSSHLAKVLAKLTRADLLESHTGAAGGYRLKVDPGETSILSIVEAIDGPLPWTGCLLGTPICAPGSCVFRELLDDMRERFTSHLSGITLADFRGLTG
jgi:Rrf2 family protein